MRRMVGGHAFTAVKRASKRSSTQKNRSSRVYAPAVLRIQLLGRMVVECDGVEISTPSARRAWSLLAYLALSPGPQPRGELAAAFWPDVLDSSARASLRSAVWSLRRALGPAAESHLIVDRNSVGLASGGELWIDVDAFDELLREDRGLEALELCRR